MSNLLSSPKHAIYMLYGLAAIGAILVWAFVLILRTHIKQRKMVALWRLNNKVLNSEILPSSADIKKFLILFKFLKDKERAPLPSASRYLSSAAKLHQCELVKGRAEEAEVRALREKNPEKAADLQVRLHDALVKIRNASKTILFIQNIREAKYKEPADFSQRTAVSV